MKLSTIVSSIALGGALAAGGVMLAPTLAGESRAAQAGERQWLSIPQVHQKLEAAGYRNIEKIERERGGYEARATDGKGERVKLYVNPQSGDVMEQRSDGKHRRADGERRQRDGADSGDCNERRCRDDLASKPVAKPAPAATR